MNGIQSLDGPPCADPRKTRRLNRITSSNPDDALILFRKRRIQLGGIVVADSLVAASPGMPVGGRLFTVAIYRSPAQRFSWRTPESDLLRSQMLVPGSAFIDAASEPWWVRWPEPASMLIVAVKLDFLAKTATDLALTDVNMTTQIGIDDQTIRCFATLFEQELANEGANGRLYLESLTEALTVDLFRRYAERRAQPRRARGGLPPALLRRLLDYIEAHLGADIALVELANLAGLSAHHFGQAFKASTGIAPHRYLIERRIQRARQLLLTDARPIAEIAADVGFANQSHLTFNFRKLVGTTPAQYRRSRPGPPSRSTPSRH
ncbi:MAG: helix-turn-helix transcriptional regulator [Alphaproteobacteria bacterium]|nr:helix-turn-helix transcriptional regulator [Alphaproteobacteria bacterium]